MDTIVMFQDGIKQTLGMLDAIVMFQDPADLELTDNLFSQLFTLETCTGHPRTHRVPNH